MKKIFARITALASLALTTLTIPFIASAQATTTGGTLFGYPSFKALVDALITFIDAKIMPLAVAIAVLAFLWNLIFYVRNQSNEKERENFKKYSINALVALFILMSLWGIIGIGTYTFFGGNPIVPQLPTHD